MARKAVIIGAGISGILTGLLLMRHGWKVTFIEARHIGAGSSSRTAAGIRQQFSTPQTVLGMRYSVDFYNKFNKTIGGSVSPIVQNGYLFLLDKKIEEAKARAKMQQEAGLSDVEFLSPEETTRRFPSKATFLICVTLSCRVLIEILLFSKAALVGSSSKKSLGNFTLIIFAPSRADIWAA